MPTDTSEKGLESLICESLVCDAGYQAGRPKDYDRDYAVDLAKLLGFLRQTQPDTLAALEIEAEGTKRAQFLARLQGEIAKRGVIDVLRSGVRHGPLAVPFRTEKRLVQGVGRNSLASLQAIRIRVWQNLGVLRMA